MFYHGKSRNNFPLASAAEFLKAIVSQGPVGQPPFGIINVWSVASLEIPSIWMDAHPRCLLISLSLQQSFSSLALLSSVSICPSAIQPIFTKSFITNNDLELLLLLPPLRRAGVTGIGHHVYFVWDWGRGVKVKASCRQGKYSTKPAPSPAQKQHF